jgi:hypothetical protein
VAAKRWAVAQSLEKIVIMSAFYAPVAVGVVLIGRGWLDSGETIAKVIRTGGISVGMAGGVALFALTWVTPYEVIHRRVDLTFLAEDVLVTGVAGLISLALAFSVYLLVSRRGNAAISWSLAAGVFLGAYLLLTIVGSSLMVAVLVGIAALISLSLAFIVLLGSRLLKGVALSGTLFAAPVLSTLPFLAIQFFTVDVQNPWTKTLVRMAISFCRSACYRQLRAGASGTSQCQGGAVPFGLTCTGGYIREFMDSGINFGFADRTC